MQETPPNSYLQQFSDFDPATLPAIPAGWLDVSYHNDICPSWETPTGLHVWVDYLEDAKREFAGHGLARFRITDDGDDLLLSSDNWQTIIEFVAGMEGA